MPTSLLLNVYKKVSSCFCLHSVISATHTHTQIQSLLSDEFCFFSKAVHSLFRSSDPLLKYQLTSDQPWRCQVSTWDLYTEMSGSHLYLVKFIRLIQMCSPVMCLVQCALIHSDHFTWQLFSIIKFSNWVALFSHKDVLHDGTKEPAVWRICYILVF